MYTIKFGTDGWREIIADNYTVENVKRVAHATAEWLKKASTNHTCTVGYDCRFGGKMFADNTASHNPPSYNGYKIKAHYGGPAIPSEIEKVEALISYGDLPTMDSLDTYIKDGMIEYAEFENMYLHQISSKFDISSLRAYAPKFAY